MTLNVIRVWSMFDHLSVFIVGVLWLNLRAPSLVLQDLCVFIKEYNDLWSVFDRLSTSSAHVMGERMDHHWLYYRICVCKDIHQFMVRSHHAWPIVWFMCDLCVITFVHAQRVWWVNRCNAAGEATGGRSPGGQKQHKCKLPQLGDDPDCPFSNTACENDFVAAKYFMDVIFNSFWHISEICFIIVPYYDCGDYCR